MAINSVWRFVLLVAVFPALLAALGCSQGGGGSGGPGPAVQLAQLINEERHRRGVQYLTWDDAITAVEQAHAQWLADKDPPGKYQWPYHEDEDGTRLFPERLDEAGITPRTSEQEWGISTTTLTNAGLVCPELPDWVYDAKWDRFGIGYVKPPKRETGYQYWVLGFVED